MSKNYVLSKTYSVSVSLEALERHMDNQLRDFLWQELHIDSLSKAHVSSDVEGERIVFFYDGG